MNITFHKFGYCCPDALKNATNVTECNPGGDLCTPVSSLRKNDQAFKALYMSYSVGMEERRVEICGRKAHLLV
jgi:hypothetical protein